MPNYNKTKNHKTYFMDILSPDTKDNERDIARIKKSRKDRV
jgi:hypothetical protein